MLATTQIIINIPEYQFPLTASIGGNNNFVALVEYRFDYLELFQCTFVELVRPANFGLPGCQNKFRWKYGEVFSLETFISVFFGHCQTYQVAERPCYHVAISL